MEVDGSQQLKSLGCSRAYLHNEMHFLSAFHFHRSEKSLCLYTVVSSLNKILLQNYSLCKHIDPKHDDRQFENSNLFEINDKCDLLELGWGG